MGLHRHGRPVRSIARGSFDKPGQDHGAQGADRADDEKRSQHFERCIGDGHKEDSFELT